MLTFGAFKLEFHRPIARLGSYSKSSNEAVFNIEFETERHFKQ